MVTLKSLVQAGLYPDEKSASREALHALWQERPQLRLDSGCATSFALVNFHWLHAAALAGISFDYMKEILVQRGIKLHLGPADLQEAHEEVAALEKSLGKLKPCQSLPIQLWYPTLQPLGS